MQHFERFIKSIIEKFHFYLEKTLIYYKTLRRRRKFFHPNYYSCYSPHHILFKRYKRIAIVAIFSSSLLLSSSLFHIIASLLANITFKFRKMRNFLITFYLHNVTRDASRIHFWYLFLLLIQRLQRKGVLG